jgi:hypothetical protein
VCYCMIYQLLVVYTKLFSKFRYFLYFSTALNLVLFILLAAFNVRNRGQPIDRPEMIAKSCACNVNRVEVRCVLLHDISWVPLNENGYYSLFKAGKLLKLALVFLWDITVIAKCLHQKGLSEQDPFCVTILIYYTHNYTHIHI